MDIEKNSLLKANSCYSDILNETDFIFLKNIYKNHSNVQFTNACHTGYENNSSQDKSIEELRLKKIDCLKKNNSWQYWYFNPSIPWEKNEFEWFKNICKKIIEELYPISSIKNINEVKHINYTMFDNGCFINNHRDGGSKAALCNILFYLNDDYEEGVGGELVVKQKNVIKPEFGRYAVIDFYYSNPEHRVNKILSDTFERKAYITTIPLIETLQYPNDKYL